MKRGQDLIGLAVMDLEIGEEIGEVTDVFFDHQSQSILGLKIKKKKGRGEDFIPYEKLYSLGEDMIVIEDKTCIGKCQEEYQSLIDEGEVIGHKVISDQGEELGMVEDILLDDKGKLIAYELSEGLIQDILKGRETLTIDNTVSYGKDAIIIESSNRLS
ncbi:hypothetical protein U472_04850 [Orenia metallireducens]|uniref:PRC-barrel domain-containing protein n=1 Tax=Orenia metallireducens TaxID=1413210 RepID=A0A1C0A970_9FIRM|nr:PRC-barrel domain-containing protein [Orenia metallireducens]OCL26827.1 hypothetical protein U472_04850 [Orenia metallireducens]